MPGRLYMNNQRSQRVVGGERFASGDILKIERQAVRHPKARLNRSSIPFCGEERPGGTSQVNLDELRVRSAPTDGGLAYDGVARDRDGIRIGG